MGRKGGRTRHDPPFIFNAQPMPCLCQRPECGQRPVNRGHRTKPLCRPHDGNLLYGGLCGGCYFSHGDEWGDPEITAQSRETTGDA